MSNDLAKTFAPFWRQGRQQLGLTQKEAAQKLNCHSSELSAYENGRVLPDLNRFNNLCTLYSFDPGLLLKKAALKKIRKEKQDASLR